MSTPVDLQANPDFELIDTWFSENLGEVKVYFCDAKGQYVLDKEFRLSSKFNASPQEVFLLEARIKELPEEITLASANYAHYDPESPLFYPGDGVNRIYMDYSGMNLRKHLIALREKGLRIPDKDSLGIYGFLMGLGSFMEQGLEFHRSICLKNLLIIDGQLKLTNPYISDSHITVVLEDFVRPIIGMGESWTPSLFLDDQLRVEASKTNLYIRQLNDLHRAYVRQMHSDSCLVFLALTNMKDDNDYVGPDGKKHIGLISADIQNIRGRFDPEMISILESILLNDGDKVPTFIEVNERISMNLRDQLVQAAGISKTISSLFDDGYLLGPVKQQHNTDHGTYQSQNIIQQ